MDRNANKCMCLVRFRGFLTRQGGPSRRSRHSPGPGSETTKTAARGFDFSTEPRPPVGGGYGLDADGTVSLHCGSTSMTKDRATEVRRQAVRDNGLVDDRSTRNNYPCRHNDSPRHSHRTHDCSACCSSWCWRCPRSGWPPPGAASPTTVRDRRQPGQSGPSDPAAPRPRDRSRRTATPPDGTLVHRGVCHPWLTSRNGHSSASHTRQPSTETAIRQPSRNSTSASGDSGNVASVPGGR